MNPRLLRTLFVLSALVTSAGLGSSVALAEPGPLSSVNPQSAHAPSRAHSRSAKPARSGTLLAIRQARRAAGPPLPPGAFLPSPHVEAVPALPVKYAVTSSPSGFSWSSAAIGALTAAVCLSMAGAVVVSRRKGEPTAP